MPQLPADFLQSIVTPCAARALRRPSGELNENHRCPRRRACWRAFCCTGTSKYPLIRIRPRQRRRCLHAGRAVPNVCGRVRGHRCRWRDRRARPRRLWRIDDLQRDQHPGHGFSGISAASGNAITINAGVDDEINLRGLLIDGLDSGANGIVVTRVGSLNIQDSLIRRFTNDGLLFEPGNSSKLSVSHTVISGNVVGIEITPTSNAAAVVAVVEQVEVYDGRSNALLVQAQSSDAGNQPIQVTVSNSTFANNSDGILCNSNAGIQKVSCMVRNSTIANNGTGANAPNASKSFVVLSRTMITGNILAWIGNVFSYGDNQIDFNVNANTAPTLIPQR